MTERVGPTGTTNEEKEEEKAIKRETLSIEWMVAASRIGDNNNNNNGNNSNKERNKGRKRRLFQFPE